MVSILLEQFVLIGPLPINPTSLLRSLAVKYLINVYLYAMVQLSAEVNRRTSAGPRERSERCERMVS